MAMSFIKAQACKSIKKYVQTQQAFADFKIHCGIALLLLFKTDIHARHNKRWELERGIDTKQLY